MTGEVSMVEEFVTIDTLGQSRTKELETDRGVSVRVVNIGNPDLDVKLDENRLEQFLDNLDQIAIGEELTVVFDNRSYHDLLGQALKTRNPIDIAMAIKRSLGTLGTAFVEEHVVYLHTQEIAFFETIGLRTLNGILMHEITHIGQTEQDPSTPLRTLIACLSQLGFGVVAGAKLGPDLARLAMKEQINLLETAGFIILIYGFGTLSKRFLYDRLPNEVEARKKEALAEKFTLVDHRPQMLTERAIRKILSQIKRHRPF